METEVVVIGGGIAGAAAAWRLAEKGRQVVLLEKGRVGEEASGRCGGGVRQQYRAPAETPFAIKAVEMWTEMAAVLDEDLEYDREGNLRLLRSKEQLEAAKVRVAREQEQGLEVNLISPDEVRERLPHISPEMSLYGATHCPGDGTANPLKVTKAIGRAAEAAGALVHINEPVRQLITAGGRVRAVLTDRNRYRPEKVILAAGAWSKGMLYEIGLNLPLTVRKSNLLITHAQPPLIPGFVSWDAGYLRQARDGNIHLGARTIISGEFDKRLEYRVLLDAGRDYPEVFPFLRDINIIRAFSGLVTYTPDLIPVVGQAPGFENLWVATGFSGHGFCLGPFMGRVVADWICGAECPEDLSAFAAGRFQ